MITRLTQSLSAVALFVAMLFWAAPAAALAPGSASFSYDHNPDGSLNGHFGWNFPGNPTYREINVYLVENGQRLSWVTPGTDTGSTDQVIWPPCFLPGPHVMRAIPRSCDGSGCVDGTPVDVPFTMGPPHITGVSAVADAQGRVTVTISHEYEFVASQTNRTMGVRMDGSDIQSAEAYQRVGSTTLAPFTLGCKPPGAYPLEVFVMSCRNPDLQERQTVWLSLPGEQGSVTIQYDHNPETGAKRLLGSYTLPPGLGAADLKVQQLPTPTGPFTFSDAATLLQQTVTTPTGTFEINPYTPPTGALQAVQVTATLSFCNGQALAQTAVPCDSCTFPPSATNAPVSFSDGNMRYTDTDPLPPQLDGVALTRTYDTYHEFDSFFGRGWWSFFDARLVVHPQTNGDIVTMTTESNGTVSFLRLNGIYTQLWPKGQQVPDTLSLDSTAGVYVLRRANANVVSLYRASDGRFAGLRRLSDGHQMSVDWNTSGLPVSVQDSWTELTWQITTDPATNRITAIDAGTLNWQYGYDTGGNLVSVLAPGSAAWRTYDYTSNRMTAAHDASGKLIESHAYNAAGAATDSTGRGDEIESIAYSVIGGDKIAQLTMKTGAVAEYRLRSIAGAYRTIRISGGCASCGAREGSYVYDLSGHVIREQDAAGYVNVHEYTSGRRTSTEMHLRPQGCDPETDAERCRLEPDDLAAAVLEATAATLKTTYAFGDANWPDKVTEVTVPSILDSTGQRRETYAYDPLTGSVTSRTLSGWTGSPAHTESRTTTAIFHNGTDVAAFDPGDPFDDAWLTLPQPAGTLRISDGPRTDVVDQTTFVYYPVHSSVPAALRGRLAATHNAAGHMTRNESYDVFGNVTRAVDANGVATEITYDILGRLRTSTVKAVPGCVIADDPLCATDLTATSTYWPEAGPRFSEQRPGGGLTIYAYDSRGRVTTLTRGSERIEYMYSSTTGKKRLERLLAAESGSWHEKKSESYAYNAQGDLSAVVQPDFASRGYTYDAAGRIATVRDENHGEANTIYLYDPAGRVSAVTQTLTGVSGGVVTRYGYDAHGNLVSVTDPNGNVTTYTYDDFGQMLSQLSPATGTTTYGYDMAGNAVLTQAANGASTARTYDALNRVLTSTSSRSGAWEDTVSWTYDVATGCFYCVGRLAAMTDPAGSTAYSYERRGLLSRETRTFPAGAGAPETAYTTRYQYDHDGNRATVIYPSNGATVTYTYDSAGRPLTASNVVTAAEYLPFGPLRQLQFANGTTQTFTYDPRYRVLTNELTAGQTTLARYEYDYDAEGNILQIRDVLAPQYDRVYTYDDLDRLLSADTGGALWQKGKYTWDATGNILSLKLAEIVPGPDDGLSRYGRPGTQANQPRGRSSIFAYAGTTSMLAEVTTNDVTRTVTHDAAGNETAHAVARAYSPRNLMTAVQDGGEPGELWSHRVDYGYDGRGIRVTRLETPVASALGARRHYLYTPELQLLATTRDSNPNWWDGTADPLAGQSIHYQIVWFGTRPIAQIHPGAPTRFTFADHLGTPIIQTDTTGAVIWQAEYEPFGNIYEMRTGNRTDQPLRFPGQEMAMNWEGEEENYNVFRWYRGGWGRYTQADPIGVVKRRGSQIEANQPYAYVDGNPLRFLDPLGLVKWDCGFVIGTGNVPIGPGGGGMLATCRSKCKNNKRVFVQLASGMVGLSAGPLPGGLSAFNQTLEDGTDTPNAQNLVGLVVYGSVGAWVAAGGGCSNMQLGKAKGQFGCSFTWFGGFDIGLDVYFGYSAIVDGPYESCCQ